MTVYLITRRHEKQIRTEQISGEDAAKYLEEKKAWKTTTIIIGIIFLSYLPPLLFTLLGKSMEYDLRMIFRRIFYYSLVLSSLYNPVVYCWRSKQIRKAIISLVKRQNLN